jgi:hypothetical protein
MKTGYIESLDGFKISYTPQSIKATRVIDWIVVDDNYPITFDTSVVQIPKMGESFYWTDGLMGTITGLPSPLNVSTTALLGRCLVTNIEAQFLNSNKNILRFTISYDNERTDDTQFGVGVINIDTLKKEYQYSGENVILQPRERGVSFGYNWQSDNVAVVQPVFKRVKTINYTIYRDIRASDWDAWQATALSLMGKVNADSATNIGMTLSGGLGCVLFEDFSTDAYNSYTDGGLYKTQLHFTYRDPDGTNTDGWNKCLRFDTGVWDIPVNTSLSAAKLYDSGNFATLFAGVPTGV